MSHKRAKPDFGLVVPQDSIAAARAVLGPLEALRVAVAKGSAFHTAAPWRASRVSGGINLLWPAVHNLLAATQQPGEKEELTL